MSTPETPANAGLTMDRGQPVGNSLDTFGRRALHVKIGNSESEAIPVFVTDSAGGSEVNLEAIGTVTTPGAEQTLLSFPVPALTGRKLHRIRVSSRVEGRWTLLADSVAVAAGRTGAATPNDDHPFSPPRLFGPGVTLELKFKSRPGSAVNEVDASIQAVDNSA